MKYEKNPDTKCTCSNPRHHAKWILNVRGITRSIEDVLSAGDVSKLTKDAYDFVMQMSGFIAHYNMQGFQSHYENTNDLIENLKRSSDTNDAERYERDEYFSQGEQKEYYAQKAQVLRSIKVLCEKYADKSELREQEIVRTKIEHLIQAAKEAQENPAHAKTLLRKLELI